MVEDIQDRILVIQRSEFYRSWDIFLQENLEDAKQYRTLAFLIFAWIDIQAKEGKISIGFESQKTNALGTTDFPPDFIASGAEICWRYDTTAPQTGWIQLQRGRT